MVELSLLGTLVSVFLMSCELYISLTALDFVDEQVHIHYPTSRVDTQQALLSTFYGRSCGQGGCASNYGGISLRNSH
jgi:hypothetical protein